MSEKFGKLSFLIFHELLLSFHNKYYVNNVRFHSINPVLSLVPQELSQISWEEK